MISRLLISFFLLNSLLFAQSGSITGRVTDAVSGDPLPGANVTLPKLQAGAVADSDGFFRVAKIPAGKYVLEVSYLGYHSFQTEVVIAEKRAVRLAVKLRPEALRSGEIIVTATRARERETPVAFSTLDRAGIESRYFAQDVPVLLSELPSTTFYSESGNGLGYNYLSIRGFDQRRISVLINGVPQNDPEDHNVYWIDFPDLLANVSDVQVQRGAGSAFYGPAAIGGSVNILTSNFSPEPKISAYAGNGSFNTRKYSLSLNSGLIKNKYIFFGRASQVKSNGYRDQSWVNFQSYFLGVARIGKKSSTRLQFYGGPIEDHLAFYGISKTAAEDAHLRRQNPIRRPDEIENFNQPHLELIHEYRPSEHLQINNTFFWIRGYGFFDFDGSWAPMSYFRITPEYGFDVQGNPDEVFVDSLLIRAFVDNTQIGWLPQLTWNTGRSEITAGAELRLHRSLHWGRIQKGDSGLPPAVSGRYSGLNYVGSRRFYQYHGGKDIASTYLHTTHRLNPRLNLMADLQFVHLRYRLNREKFIGTDFSVDYNFLNPRLGLNYNASRFLNFFVNYSRTSREPRLKNLYNADEASTPASWGAVVPQFKRRADGSIDYSQPLVTPEKLNDYEFGIGIRTHRLKAGVNLYYMDFRDEIIKKGQLDIFGQPVTGNARKTLHKGVELNARVALSRAFTFSGNAMFSDNTLRDYSIFDGSGHRIRLDGNQISGFPNTLANLRLTFRQKGFAASLASQYVGKQYTDNFQNELKSVDAYWVFNGYVSYKMRASSNLPAVTLQFHVRNLFNRLYIAHGEGSDFFPAATRQFFLNAKIDLGR